MQANKTIIQPTLSGKKFSIGANYNQLIITCYIHNLLPTNSRDMNTAIEIFRTSLN